ncbi:MAG: hypothetical protein JXB05_33665 [Myxococcaceae bacterium]|nr:hypothetical protein [Myxococcaceae bacterium]
MLLFVGHEQAGNNLADLYSLVATSTEAPTRRCPAAEPLAPREGACGG